MNHRRRYYPTKAAWAAATAAHLRAQEAEAYAERHPASNWRAIQAKMNRLANLRRQAGRYERMAERFQSLGV